MTDVGIRELNKTPQKVIAKVLEGQLFTVTDHGKPVAQIGPLNQSTINRLLEAGLAKPAKGSFEDLTAPTKAPPRMDASKILEDMRAEERY
jgi:antitoxin (DNA-binding transcriptional repressor) of toxin-antitoxin stability system